MLYYHVIVGSTSGRPFDEHVPDVSREWLEERILVPRSEGTPITVNGKTIPIKRISRVVVKATTRPTTSISPPFVRAFLADADDVTDEFITGPPGSESAARHGEQQETRPPAGAREVFVVHGRNMVARNAMFEFLRAVELRPLEWSELVTGTGEGSPYTGDVLKVAFSQAHAVVVLMTPDDEVRLREQLRKPNEADEAELKGQARPNVLFEAGMAMGRNEQRTVIVELGALRAFSDIAGRHTIRLDDTSERRQELAQRLKDAGCPVNLNGTDWHSAGDFAGALKSAVTPSAAALPEIGDIATTPDAASEVTVPQISVDAAELLMNTVKTRDARLFKITTAGGLAIRAGAEFYGEMGDRRSEARWENALDELIRQGLVQDINGKCFQVTHHGFLVAENLSADG